MAKCGDGLGCLRTAGRWLWWYRKQLIAVLTPLLMAPLPLVIEGKEAQCAYVLVVVSVYWCTQCVPLVVAGLMPVFMMPLFGILTPVEVASDYYKDIVMTLLGSMMLAIAIENVNLHKRIALGVLKSIGTSQQWIMFGFVMSSYFLSMWINNAGTVALLLSILEALLLELEEIDKQDKSETPVDGGDIILTSVNAEPSDADEADTSVNADNQLADDDKSKAAKYAALKERRAHEASAITYGVMCGSKMGGMAVLTGTMDNLIIKDYIDDVYFDNGKAESPVTFAKWMAMAIPISLINIIAINAYMQFYHMGYRSFFNCFKKKVHTEDETRMKGIIDRQYKALGPIRYAEVLVIVMFSTVALLWFLRDPGIFDGWKELFPAGFTSATLPSILISFTMFFIPQTPPWHPPEPGRSHPKTLLEWPIVHTKMPWGLMFVVGGGMAIAHGCKESGLTAWIGTQLSWMEDINIIVLVFLLALSNSLITELMSLITVLAIFLPVAASTAVNMGYSPLYLMLACGLGAQFTFMLPIASIGSALTYSFGRIRVIDMVKAGFVVNLFCCSMVTLGLCTWGRAIFDMDTVPWGIEEDNSTVASSTMTPP